MRNLMKDYCDEEWKRVDYDLLNNYGRVHGFTRARLRSGPRRVWRRALGIYGPGNLSVKEERAGGRKNRLAPRH